MKYKIVHAEMKQEGKEYVGHVRFHVEGHENRYEMTLHSTDGRDWAYGLHFADDSGDEDRISSVEEWLEEDDEAFDAMVAAAQSGSGA